MAALKTLVVGMGVLIVAGVIVLAILLTQNFRTSPKATAELQLALPAHAQVKSVVAHAETVDVVMDFPNHPWSVWVFDKQKGTVLQKLTLQTAP